MKLPDSPLSELLVAQLAKLSQFSAWRDYLRAETAYRLGELGWARYWQREAARRSLEDRILLGRT